jgi:hypothetical protein
MTEVEATGVLQRGAAILNEVLAPYGFALSSPTSGTGSGGSFASCEFSRGNRKLRLNFRYSLGLVEYEVGGVALSHEAYMWSVTGSRGATSYPGFSSDPLDGFRHLAIDLKERAQDFLTGSDQDFIAHASRAAELRSGPPRLPR